jgi:hypothetical protein
MGIYRAIITIILAMALAVALAMLAGCAMPERVQITAAPGRCTIDYERGAQVLFGERRTAQVITADGDTSQTATINKTTIGTLGAAALASAATYLGAN